MPTVSDRRRIIAALCIAALFFALVTQTSHGSAFAVLVPFWFTIAILLVLKIQSRTTESKLSLFPFCRPILSRAPPIQ
jgi:hypothetical protein